MVRFATPLRHISLLNRLDAVPATLQTLLPQTDSVVPTADSKDITAKTPAHAPNNSVKLELGACPAGGIRGVGGGRACPDADSSVLGCRGYV